MTERNRTCPHCNSKVEPSADDTGVDFICPNCGKRIQTVGDDSKSPDSAPTTSFDDDAANDNTYKDRVNTEFNNKSDSFEKRMFSMEEDDVDFGKSIKDTLSEFNKFDYSLLKPMLMVFVPRIIKQKAVQWVVGFGLFPLFILFLSQLFKLSFEKTSWFLGAYFCIFWIVFFNSTLAPSKEIKKQGIKWALFTILIGLPILLLWRNMPIMRDIYSGTQSHAFIWRMLAFILGVGVCEELCKALPLLLFGRNKPKLLTPRNAIYFGIMSGLGFALAEVVEYTYSYWQDSAVFSAKLIRYVLDLVTDRGYIDVEAFEMILKDQAIPILVENYGSMVTVQIVRFMSLPLLHAAWAGIAGYFIGLSLLKKKAQWVFIIIGIAAMAVLHGLYDVFIGSSSLLGIGIGIGFAAVSILILMSYLSEEEKITGSVERSVL